MNTKSKTYYDIVPKELGQAVLLRFRTRKEARKYIEDNHLQTSWVIVPACIVL